MSEIPEETSAILALQAARGEAFEKGDYTLDDNEGFWCNECGWRGLAAKMVSDDGDFVIECQECGGEGVESSTISNRRLAEKIANIDTDIELTDE